MKLLLCEDCWDVFKLDYEMRQCKCGKVKGRYLDHIYAEVTPNAVSLALGNGSVEMAIEKMRQWHKEYPESSREMYQTIGKIGYAWVRPNEGSGNPHTKILS